MTIPKHIMDEARAVWATLPKEAAGIHAIAEALHRIDLAAEQRGMEMERERATKIMLGVSDVLKRHLIDKATPELLESLADAMNAASDEMEAEAVIRSRTTEG